MPFITSTTLLLSQFARHLRARSETELLSRRDLSDIGGDARLGRTVHPIALRETLPFYDRVR
jgi:hypothetical protein